MMRKLVGGGGLVLTLLVGVGAAVLIAALSL